MTKTVNFLKAVIVAVSLLPKLITDVIAVIEAIKKKDGKNEQN
jgi:hypothetical protein